MIFLFVQSVDKRGTCENRECLRLLTLHGRKSEWESTEITIRICGKGDTLNDHDAPPEPAANPSRNSGARQSKRLRQVKQNGERRKMTIAKTMTLKDIKVQVYNLNSVRVLATD